MIDYTSIIHERIYNNKNYQRISESYKGIKNDKIGNLRGDYMETDKGVQKKDLRYKDKDWLYEQYIILEKSIRKIAIECGCSNETIRCWLIKFNIKRRTLSEALAGDKHPFYGIKFCKEHREKLSIAKIGNKNASGKRTEEQKERISEALKGHIPWNKGMKGHLSLETKKKMSEAQLKRKKRDGYINSPEARKKISEINKEKLKGKNNPMYGKIVSKETIKKKSNAMKQFYSKKENRIKQGIISKKLWEDPNYRNKIISALKNKEFSIETKKKISEAKKNHKVSNETRKKISESLYGRFKGDKHPNWNPNRAEVYAPYGENFYNPQLREEKWSLQKGRDLLTGIKLEEGSKSHYHHIDWDKSNDYPDNHIWLNSSNHMRVHTKKKRKYYESLLIKNLQTLKENKIPENWNVKNKEMFRQENLIQLKLDEISIEVK